MKAILDQSGPASQACKLTDLEPGRPVEALNGALIRYPTGWRWKDGEPAIGVVDRIRDQDFYYFALARADDDVECVLVPEWEVKNAGDLKWVADRGYPLGPCRDAVSMWHFHLPYPKQPKSVAFAYLVPCDDFEEWTGRKVVTGAVWDHSLTEFVMQKARSLGVLVADNAAATSLPAAARATPAAPWWRADVELIVDALDGSNIMFPSGGAEGPENPAADLRHWLISEVQDAIAQYDLDYKWGVSFWALQEKLFRLPAESHRMLALGIMEYWDRIIDQAEEPDLVLDRLVLMLRRSSAAPDGMEGPQLEE
jgi:hypothetical protein